MGRVSSPLPRLRADLDFMPSPVEGGPACSFGIRSVTPDSVLIVPPPLVPLQCLTCFDGQQTQLDLQAMLVEILRGSLRSAIWKINSSTFWDAQRNFSKMRPSTP